MNEINNNNNNNSRNIINLTDDNVTGINLIYEITLNMTTEFYDKIITSTKAKPTSDDEMIITTESATILPFLMDEYEIGPKRDPLYVVIPITIIYLIIFITGVIGNISTCIVISKNKSMHTATNYYLFSLAVSDFLLLVSGVPQEMYFIWSKYPYVFGEMFCILRGLTAETSANATVLTITAFTVERYVAICHPFLSHTMSKLSRAVRLIILVWIISFGLALPQALQFGVINTNGIDQCVVKRVIIQHSFELSTFLFFLAPMTLITVLYILIGLKLHSSSTMKRENGGNLNRRPHLNSCRQQTSQGTRRVLKMLVAVVVAFFICWAPFHAQRLIAIYGTGTESQPPDPIIYKIFVIMTYSSGIFYYLSTCINPLLYNIMSNKFREAFKETLAKCCHISRRGRDNKKRIYRVLSRCKRRHNERQDQSDYSGNSVRDESVYSSSTQKQSIDSVTLTRITEQGNYFPRMTLSMTVTHGSENDLIDTDYDSEELGYITTTGNMLPSTFKDQKILLNILANKEPMLLRSVVASKKSTNKLEDTNIDKATANHDNQINIFYRRQEYDSQNRKIDYRHSELNCCHLENANSLESWQRYNGINQEIVKSPVSMPLNHTNNDDEKYYINDELDAYMEELRMRELRA